MSTRRGHPVAAHYGSASGELAVCVSAVGLAHRSDLAVVTIDGPGHRLVTALARTIGDPVAPGGAIHAGGAWWCRSADRDELVVLCGRDAVPRLIDTGLAACRHFGLTVTDRSAGRTVLAVVGRRTWPLLASLGLSSADGDLRGVPPFSRWDVDGQEVSWLIESEATALAVVDEREADRVWQAIERIGRRYGLSCVGYEAIERFAVLRRSDRLRPEHLI